MADECPEVDFGSSLKLVLPSVSLFEPVNDGLPDTRLQS